jgi:hypothetical protein
MVQHAQEHHDIEVSDLGGREAANVVDAVFGLRSQQFARDAEALAWAWNRPPSLALRGAPIRS